MSENNISSPPPARPTAPVTVQDHPTVHKSRWNSTESKPLITILAVIVAAVIIFAAGVLVGNNVGEHHGNSDRLHSNQWHAPTKNPNNQNNWGSNQRGNRFNPESNSSGNQGPKNNGVAPQNGTKQNDNRNSGVNGSTDKNSDTKPDSSQDAPSTK